MEKEMEDRRPVRTRDARWATFTAQRLQRAGATPNGISLASILFALVAGLCFAFAFRTDAEWLTRTLVIVAAIGIQGRLLCNLFDGMVAVEGGLRSAVGALYNDMPDRISDSLILLGVGYGLTEWSAGASLGWAAALLAMMTAYIRLLGASCQLPQRFSGPMAKQHRMALLTLAAILTAVLPAWGQTLLFGALALVVVGCLVTCVLRTRQIVAALQARGAADV